MSNLMHQQFLLAALDQAKRGQGICAPNPSVGAVAVRNGKIIAQAWHKGAGSPHAEQLLITQFPAKTPGVTMYVTLEPCNHWGRTPPCTEAIIEHGIEQVIYGFRDPNPLVIKNDTPRTLRKHNIDCLYYPQPEINEFYKSYVYWTATGRPRVVAKIAHSLDAKIAGRRNKRVNLSNDLCKKFTHQLRSKTDIILTSAKTIYYDDPLLNVRLNGKQQSKILAVLDQHLTMDLKAKALQHARRVHIFHSSSYKPPPKVIPGITYHPIQSGKYGLDLVSVLEQLGQEGYHDVFIEAGGTLFSAFHKENLVQQTYVYIVPETLTTDSVSAYPIDNLFTKKAKISWLPKDNNMILQMDWQEEACLQA